MGYTRQLGQLAYLITYDGSGNITIPAAITQGSVTSSMLKTDASGKLVAAVAGTDFVAPSSLSSYVPYTGATGNVDLGSNSLTANNGYFNNVVTINATGNQARALYLVTGTAGANYGSGTGVNLFSETTDNLTVLFSTATTTKRAIFNGSGLTAQRTYDLPNASGTLALTSDISTAVSNLVASAPATLDTLNELAAALGNDANFATTVATSIGTKVPSTRTITINGTAYDLSADRSWTIVSGVSSFNTRTGAITLTSGDVTGALGYTPVTNARTITINGTTYDLSADRSWSIVAGLSSFNTRTGAITLLDTDVTGALGYTPVTNARTITINGTTYDLSANRTWVVDTSSVTTRVIQKFTATSSQTTFTITGGYTVGMVDVFLNGIKLDNAVDFTATDGSVVTLAVGAATGDIVEVYKYGGQFIANNTLRQSTLFTATAGQTTFTVNYSVGFVDVFYNGSKLDSSEFTATNGTSIVLGTACVLNDKVEVLAYNYTVGAFTGVGGSGTTNYISKWTATGTLGNSLIYDNGTNVGINTTSPFAIADTNFTVNGTTSAAIQLGYNGTRYGQFYTDSGEIRLSAVANLPLTFYSNNLERMRISASGNVGIGTSSPAVTLHTLGKIRSQDSRGGSYAAVEIYGGDSSYFPYISVDQNNPLTFITGGSERMRISANGYIGINTTTPGATLPSSTGWSVQPSKIRILQINSTDGYANSGVFIRQSDNTTGLDLWSDNYYGPSYIDSRWNDPNAKLIFRLKTHGTPVTGMTISNNGLVTIGNSTDITSFLSASNGSLFLQGGAYTSSQIQTIDFGSTSYSKPLARIGARISSAGTFLQFGTSNSYADGVTNSGLAIDYDGRLITGNQPAFMAYGNGDSFNTVSGSYLTYPSVHLNRGNHYNASNGVFTAPVAGVYCFSWSDIGGSTDDVYRFYLRINNANFLGDYHLRLDTTATGGNYGTNGNRTVIINLAAGDTARIYMATDSTNTFYAMGATTNPYHNFMGYFLG